ncbi:hypothetical protein WS91_06915 [Burkholderia sp. MSMB1498]|nr:hypothetical protein WS91_06915 [Burkholderia sp. MSMB1498]
MNLHDRAIQRYRFNSDANNLCVLQLREHSVQYAVARRTIHARVDSMPATEAWRQAAPFTSVLSNIEERVEHLQVRQAHIASLSRQAMFDLFELGFGDFHLRSITLNYGSVKTPWYIDEFLYK